MEGFTPGRASMGTAQKAPDVSTTRGVSKCEHHTWCLQVMYHIFIFFYKSYCGTAVP